MTSDQTLAFLRAPIAGRRCSRPHGGAARSKRWPGPDSGGGAYRAADEQNTEAGNGLEGEHTGVAVATEP
jgi:hypothetical protein